MPEKSAVSLKEQELILRAKLEWEQTFDAVSELIFIVDKDYAIVRANKAMAEHCGIGVTELVGRKCHEVIQFRNCSVDKCPHIRALERLQPETLEFKLNNRDSTYEVTISPMINAEGQADANVFVARDVTEKIKIERALQESEQLFSLFMENLPLAVSMKDQAGRVLFANEYLKDLLGVTDMTGLTAEDLFPPETAQKIASDDRETLTQGLGLYKDFIRDGSGNELVFDTYKFPVPRADGTTALGTISVDVTEKRRHEKMLAEQKEQLTALNSNLNSRINEAVAELRNKDAILIQESRLTAMGEMISNIAHQWRQPLNNIGLIVQGLQLAFKADDLTAEELDQDINDTMKVLQQISETIDDFRNFFSHEKETSSFMVNDLVSRTLFFAESSLRSKGIRIEIEEQPCVSAEGYPNEYTQALLNILLNARDALLDHQQQNPTVTIRIFEENGRSVVIVRDNGGGIPEHVLPKIFDPYFTTKQQGKGTGIGLYMAKTIIENHMHGRLTACSRDGCAEFRIEL